MEKIKCKNAGKCKICGEFYVGQIKNKFNIRQNAQRNAWGKEPEKKVLKISDENDDQALFFTFQGTIRKKTVTTSPMPIRYGFFKSPK